jgi:hypothetical protein
MPLSIFFPRVTRRSIGTLTLDATMQEDHSFNGQVTDNPVEGGATVSDHVIRDPLVLTMEGVVTDSPAQFVTGAFGAFSGRSQSAYETLVDLRNRSALIDVQTGYALYRNMVIESLRVPNDRTSSFKFTAVLKQFEFTESETVAIPADTTTEPDLATGELDGGRQQTRTASEQDAAQGSSLLSTLLGGF